MTESLQQQIARLTSEVIELVPYDPTWPGMFEREKEHLQSRLPGDLVYCIEHFGSTAVPGLSAKPIIDVLVGVRDLGETRERIVPRMRADNYEYLWRPTYGDDGPPWYAWFIKRNAAGHRTHHIHMVEPTFTSHWNRLLFRDYLIEHADVRREYERLKRRLADQRSRDRVGYTQGKTDFIERVTRLAAEHEQS